MQHVVIELLGGESTGKSTLATNLRDTAQAHHIPHRLVSEHLREWVETHGRTPTAHEQAAIATSQHGAIHAAVAALTSGPQASEDSIGLVFADTSALQTAAYSAHYFSDHRLGATTVTTYPPGVRCIRLLMGLDLPWTADPGQRDGRTAQEAVDTHLRDHLHAHALPFQVIYGKGPARTQAAWTAIANGLARENWLSPQPTAQRRTDWVCQDCSDPDCELRLFTGLLAGNAKRFSVK